MRHLGSGSGWRIGLTGQTLIPLIAGTVLLIGAVTVLCYHMVLDSQRAQALAELTRLSVERSERDQPLFGRVENRVSYCRRLLQQRIQSGRIGLTTIPAIADGTRRLLPAPGASPLSAFIAPSATAAQIAAAGVALDILADLGPAWAMNPSNLSVALPGCWLVGYGQGPAELVAAMLPTDPVLLPVERQLLDMPDQPGASGGVRWSRAFYEPGTDRWLITAAAGVELPGVGRVAVSHNLPIEEILDRATRNQPSVSETAVVDSDGLLLAHTRFGQAIRHSGGMLAVTAVDDPLLVRAQALIAQDGLPAELVTDAACWIGVSRFAGPRWKMMTIYPREAIERQARAVALNVLVVGVIVVAGLALLVVLVLRLVVSRPLRRLGQAARALADGSPAWQFETAANNEIGDLARAFQAMAEAVTRRERELESALASLREREELSRALVDSAADAVFLLVEGRIHDANPRAAELFGCPEEQLEGSRLADNSPELQPGGEPSAAAAERHLAATIAGGTQHFAWRHRRRDGSEFDAEIGLARILLPGPSRQLAVVRDVTRRNQMEAQLRQGQKLESLGQLAGGIAHDFNNMLAAIMGAAELLARTAKLEDGQRKWLDSILNGCHRAAGLTGKLLAFARRSGRGQSTPIDVHQVARDAVAMLESTLVDKRIRIEVDLAATASTVVGDAGQLQNLLINLGVNARDAMPDGGTLRIATAIRGVTADEIPAFVIPVHPGRFLDLAVSDTGTGIPAAVLSRIFEPFFTTKGVGQGTGLGLAAVYGTVQEHGGTIAVDTAPGQGTTFHILLPLSSERAGTARAERQVQRRVRTGAVLLIEDEESVRRTGRRLLEELGWEVIEASDGQEGLERFREQSAGIAVVLMDMEMPRLRGIDCLRQMRLVYPQVRVVLCSGFPRDTSAAQLRQEGFAALLPKPYRLHELDSALTQALAS